MVLDEISEEIIYEVDDIVKCINDSPLVHNHIAPPIVIGEEYVVKNITLDSRNNQHLDLGLASLYDTITSWNTGEALINGDKVHWVHPSRVKFVK